MTREEAIERLNIHKSTSVFVDSIAEAIDMAIEALQTIDNCDQCEWCCPSDGTPTIHVVRCKDCKHSFYDKHYETYNCRKHEYVECFDADDYCSWGERND